MARARSIKPTFFKYEDLAELAFSTRLLFIGLWTMADRDGRLEDRPKRLKMELFPADDIDVDAALNDLARFAFIERYEADGAPYIQVVDWPSTDCFDDGVGGPGRISFNVVRTRLAALVFARDGRICRRCGATERLSIDHIIPLRRGGSSEPENLQVLCISCNSSKGAR